MIRRSAAGLLALIMCISMVLMTPLQALAATSYTLSVEPENGPIAGATFRAYRVGEWKNGAYVLTGAFRDYQVTMEDLDKTAGVKKLADTLSFYVDRDKIASDGEGVTDSAGIAKITGLERGLYLVIGDSARVGSKTYTFQSAIVYVASADAAVYPKNESKDDPVIPPTDPSEEPSEGPTTPPTTPPATTTTTRKTTQVRVVKVWDDDGYDRRPTSVVMQLLCDGEVYDEVTLTAAKSWQYTWSDLRTGHTWQAMEKRVPAGYTVAMDRDGNTFTVTNTRVPDEPDKPSDPIEPTDPVKPTDPPKPTDPVKPTDPPKPTDPVEPDQPHEPDQPNQPDRPGDPNEPEEPKLPQTGQAWWPVPLLVAAGLVLTVAGILLYLPKSKRKDGHE